MPEYKLDLRKYLCPMPVIKLQNKVNSLACGDKVIAICKDPGTRHDIPAWCEINGHTITSIVEQDTELHFTVIVGD